MTDLATPAAKPAPAISSATVWYLGWSQLITWGISYYLIGVFGELMVADLGWSKAVVYGGFSAALVVQGAVSPWVGRAVDHLGGKPVMVTGSVVMAVALVGLALTHSVIPYYAAWMVLGVGMRMTLYDAAFAALARIGGAAAKRPISQITLLGGLASTALWPIGHALAGPFGWRGAVFAYAVMAVLTVPLHWAIPSARFDHDAAAADPSVRPQATRTDADRWLAAVLYTLIVTLNTCLNSGMSALMIGMLISMGVGEATAVWIATLRGVGQALARLGEVLFGQRRNPLALGVIATGMLPVCFVVGLFSGSWLAAGVVFAFLYGAGNGLVTIVRGTAPLVLFDPRVYGSLVGRLLVPSFFLSALSPLGFALVIERWGDFAGLHLATGIAAISFAAAVALWWRFR